MIRLTVSVKSRRRSYPILAGARPPGSWPDEVESLIPADKHFAVIDRRADRAHHLSRALAGRKGWRAILVEAGEGRKTLGDYAALCEKLLAGGLDRTSVVVAIGGGVTGDLAGFAAASLLRGVRLVQIPTTLLAQVDSSVGGKTGINLPGGKNLLGAFHQPEAVLIDPIFLTTLPEREYRAGLAEAVKCGIISDPDFFKLLSGSARLIERRDPSFLAETAARCCRLKAAAVGADERDFGPRLLLNLGHTFGHALEVSAGFRGSLIHGEAVGAGLVLAAAFAVRRGLAKPALARRIADLLRRLRIPARLADLPAPAGRAGEWRRRLTAASLSAALARDKKAASAGLALVLPWAIGDCRLVRGVPVEEAAAFMLEAE